jgi:hypothetical protein
VEATSGQYDHTFARCATRSPDAASYMDTPNVGAQADFWLHCETVIHGYNYSSTQERSIELLDSGGIAQLRITVTYNATQQWNVDKWNGSTWVTLKSFTSSNSLQVVDLHVVSNTSSGSIDLYIAGTKRLSTGTVDLSGLSGVAQCRMWGNNPSFGGAYQDYSQVVMATESTIGMRVSTVPMTGQGATHTFDTGGYTNIDEAVYSDADFVQSGTAGQVELFTGTSVFNLSGYSVRAVALTARAKTDGSAPTHFRFQLRSGGMTYDNGADLPLDFGYGNFCAVWENNPATLARFQPSEIAGLQFGLKSVT